MTDHIPPEEMTQILDLIYSGQKLAAVKHYMELRGASLVDAKQFVEQLTDKLKEASPERFAGASKAGCFGVLLLVALSLSSAAMGALWGLRIGL